MNELTDISTLFEPRSSGTKRQPTHDSDPTTKKRAPGVYYELETTDDEMTESHVTARRAWIEIFQ